MQDPPKPRFGGFYGETVRVLLINAPLALFFVSAHYTSWLFQERPNQPDLASGFVKLKESRGSKVYTTHGEAWASQALSNLFWITLAVCAVLLWLRTYLRPNTAVVRPPDEGVPYPAEFVAILIGIAGIAYSILMRGN